MSDYVTYEPWLQQGVSLATDSLRDTATVVLGIAMPGATIEIWDKTINVLIGTGHAGTDGTFAINVSPPLVYNHKIVAIANGVPSEEYVVGSAVTISGPSTSVSSVERSSSMKSSMSLSC